jgi:hypothetical protein
LVEVFRPARTEFLDHRTSENRREKVLLMLRENQVYWFRAVGLWFLLMTAETLQGLWRAKVLALWIGDAASRDVGVFTGSLLILLITFACIRWISARENETLLIVGLTWVALTVAYEFALGHFVFHLPWTDMASEFDVFRGRLLPIGLVILMFAPLLAAHLHGRAKRISREGAA